MIAKQYTINQSEETYSTTVRLVQNDNYHLIAEEIYEMLIDLAD